MKKYLGTEIDPSDIVDVFDELPLWSAPFGLKLLAHVDYRPNISALDIGFGTGFPLTEIAMRLGDGATVYGIDPWKEAMIRAEKKIDRYGIRNIRLIEGSAEEIPLANESIDLIVSNNGINNVGDMEKVISECARIIKPGGQFIQTMNLDRTMFEFYEEFERVLSDLRMEKEIGLMHKHIYEKRRPLDEIMAMLHKNGFVIRKLEHDQFTYRFADGTAMFNHYFIRLAFMDSWMKIVPKEKAETIFDAIESRLNERARDFGTLTLSIPFAMINAAREGLPL
ncbi:MAG TPA: methyltransferase domain-containing protein [Bacteroidota bacterium]|nr:methyltransferase domain-containing protein [Bacteroidota bacterium]